MDFNEKSNEDMLINEIKKIKVTKPNDRKFIVHNPTDLPIISQEKKRLVISIDEEHCATYFETEEKAEKEFQALKMGAKRSITPIVFERRGTYVVMESIKAPTVVDYLMENTLTKELTKNLLQLLEDFKAVGYTRLDHDPAYIYVMPDGSLKVVNVHRNTKLPNKLFPKRMIKNMGKHVTVFLQYVKELEPALYSSWTNHPEFNATIKKSKLNESIEEV